MNSQRISRGQRVAILVIVLLGLAASAGLLLWRDTPPGGAEQAHDDHAGHDDHADEPAAKKAGHEDHEDAVQLTAAQIQAAQITVEAAAPAAITATLQLPGEIGLNEDRTAHVVPRVAGVVESVAADLGQQVKQGQLLAVIASATLSELRSEQQAAQKRLDLARLMHDREKALWQDRISPEMDYLQARQALREAEIAATNAQQKLKALGAPAMPAEIGRAHV